MGNKNGKIVPLSDADYEFILEVTSLNIEEIDSMYHKFRKECPNGGIPRKKFTEILWALVPGVNAQMISNHLFRVFDEDNSGQLEFREFLFALSLSISQKPTQKLNWVFRIFDVDGSGFIERHELEEVLRALYGMIGVQNEAITHKCADLFDKMDVDQSGSISKEEFLTACLTDQDLCNKLSKVIG